MEKIINLIAILQKLNLTYIRHSKKPIYEVMANIRKRILINANKFIKF
ncbi:hypothetical protein CSPB12327_04170 [Campylobacter sp. RM12327]|nr:MULTISPECIES: hypothetical protein [Campylobacter]MBE7358684.1 hypothetical protein [Campylobacter sp. RM11302]MBF6669339.1 hypothetical protein [Campylobacter sp. RM12327]MBF6674607.1 hypothetical protein [Campylobacter sp. RM13538]MBF6676114.1 hypothetical protein [Campylobacter sp. RM12321]MBF6678456.1 hypothetical protein [Campylobacter sp. RM11259]